ncbi:MAG: hypothetical protein AAFQ68_01215 [Bacteroidota bacterium]
MRIILLCLLCLGSNLLIGQESISTNLTDAHQQVQGTKVFMVVPESFAVATQFQGFQDFDRSASLLVAILETPVQPLLQAFTKEALKGQGVEMEDKEPISLNGMKGTWITGTQSAYGSTFNKYILVFGDESFTCIVNGMYPEESKEELDALVVDAMRSTYYDQEAELNYLDALSFVLDTKGTKMQFGTLLTGSALYTVDGKVPTESEDKANFLAGPSLNPSLILDEKAFCIKRLKQLPYENLSFREEDIIEVDIDSLHGYSIPAVGTDSKDEAERFIYQTILFTDDGNYYILLGTAATDYEENRKLFALLTERFRRK